MALKVPTQYTKFGKVIRNNQNKLRNRVMESKLKWTFICAIAARTVSVSDLNTGRKGFKHYLIVGRYLGVAFNCLSLL